MSIDYNDNIHRIIIERLTERNRKLGIISECELSAIHRKRFAQWAGMAVAACVLCALFFIGDIGNGAEENVRSGQTDVQSLVNEGKYDDALYIINSNIHSTDSTLNALKSSGATDEETLYEIQAAEQKRRKLIKLMRLVKEKIK